jgi:DNA-binding transcriptional regulator YdaS (Cro superfamily)
MENDTGKLKVLCTGAVELRVWMARNGVNGAQAARLFGVSRGRLASYRTGRYRPSLDSALAMERVTGGAVPAASWAKVTP